MTNLPKPVVEAFLHLADAQRDKPERAMLLVQRANAGGVLNPVVEHIGDLTHRMTEEAKYGSAGYEIVKDKVQKCLRWLTHPYGFEKEHRENIEGNARDLGMPTHDHAQKVESALDYYAKMHQSLVVYNRCQWLARQAAVAVGHQNWSTAISCLRMLQEKLANRAEWDAVALSYKQGNDGRPMSYDRLTQEETANMNLFKEIAQIVAEAKGEHWMQDAFKHNKGKLHKRLHVKPGKKIPAAKLDKATYSKDASLRKEAQAAKNARKATAADEWWNGLSKAQKDAYIHEHPESHYATGRKYDDHTKNPFHKVLAAHGFKHYTTEHKPFHLTPKHNYTEHTYRHPDHGHSQVIVTQEHEKTRNVKPYYWIHRHEQRNGLFAP